MPQSKYNGWKLDVCSYAPNCGYSCLPLIFRDLCAKGAGDRDNCNLQQFRLSFEEAQATLEEFERLEKFSSEAEKIIELRTPLNMQIYG